MSIKQALGVSFVVVGLVAACSDTTTANPLDGGLDGATAGDGATVDAGPAGGPVTGPADMHCVADGGAMISRTTNYASCHPDAGALDAGDADGGDVSDYGPTMDNATGYDDDCKYQVTWTATPIRQATDVTFTVVVAETAPANAPMTPFAEEGAASGFYPVRAEVYLNDTHPAPNTNQTSSQTATPGTYTVGPIRFDASGQWTVRFHMHETCDDTLDDSPHGHAAFYVQVP